ncbi:MAG: cupin domain-containing protein [Candidatus Hydrogenedentes bacterium]|nr:cupin domain-containing protein [Candidatus Hydrogenedentota bacterium]
MNMHGAFLGRATKDNSTWFIGSRHSYVALPRHTGGAFTLFDAVYRKDLGPPPHMHTREDELFCVLEGRVRFSAGAAQADCGPGTVAFLPRDLAHVFEPLTAEVRMAILLIPGGFEEFFETFSEPAKDMGLPPLPVTMPDIPTFLAKGAEYGLELLPPGTTVAQHPSASIPGLHATITAPGEGECLNVIGIPTWVRTTTAESNGTLSAFITDDPRFAGPPLHIHRNEDESMFVLEGEYRIQTGDAYHVARPGDFAFFPRGLAHTYARVSETPGRMLILTTPGGYEAFFRDVDTLCAEGQPSVPELAQVAATHGVEIVGPPIQP